MTALAAETAEHGRQRCCSSLGELVHVSAYGGRFATVPSGVDGALSGRRWALLSQRRG